ncbi:MAG: NAD(P)H-dependent oxidoreductase [Planctomycetota bacterium]|nr:NAD(P)H-dependent oxidoreductase [Planctomycetota bacterium]
MTITPKILAFAGSLRRDSFNKKLVRVAMAGARQAGAEVTFIDLKDYPLPIYDGDIEDESGMPENALKLQDLFCENNGLLIACPEYNSSFSGALKNTIDWISRPRKERTPLFCFDGKVAGLMAASPGGLGGIRMLPSLRTLLQNIKVIVTPTMMSVPKAHQAFNEQGDLIDAKQKASVEAIGAEVTNLLAKLNQ